MKSLSVEIACLLGIQNEIQAICIYNITLHEDMETIENKYPIVCKWLSGFVRQLFYHVYPNPRLPI